MSSKLMSQAHVHMVDVRKMTAAMQPDELREGCGPSACVFEFFIFPNVRFAFLRFLTAAVQSLRLSYFVGCGRRCKRTLWLLMFQRLWSDLFCYCSLLPGLAYAGGR